MGNNYHGRASVSVNSPEAMAICDRCGFLYNHPDLSFQYDWRGNRMVNLNVLVCRRCTDKPQEQFRNLLIPADPQPIKNPRPPAYINFDEPNGS